MSWAVLFRSRDRSCGEGTVQRDLFLGEADSPHPFHVLGLGHELSFTREL